MLSKNVNIFLFGGGGGGGLSPKAIISNFYYHFCGTKVKSDHTLQNNLKNLSLILYESSMNIQQTFTLTEVIVSLRKYKKNQWLILLKTLV